MSLTTSKVNRLLRNQLVQYSAKNPYNQDTAQIVVPDPQRFYVPWPIRDAFTQALEQVVVPRLAGARTGSLDLISMMQPLHGLPAREALLSGVEPLPSKGKAGQEYYPGEPRVKIRVSNELLDEMEHPSTGRRRRRAIANFMGKCIYHNWKVVSHYTGEVWCMNCHSWDCVVHAPTQQAKFAHKFNNGLPEYFATITKVPEDEAVSRLKWQQFIRCLRTGRGLKRRDGCRQALEAHIAMINHQRRKNRRKYLPLDPVVAAAALDKMADEGYDFQYGSVNERGEHAEQLLHRHLLIRGEWPPEVVVAAVAHHFGFGWIADSGLVWDRGAGWYISKYLTKGSDGLGNRNKVSFSRGYDLEKRPKPPKGMYTLIGKPNSRHDDFRKSLASTDTRAGLIETMVARELVHVVAPAALAVADKYGDSDSVHRDAIASMELDAAEPLRQVFGRMPLILAAREIDWEQRCSAYLYDVQAYYARCKARLDACYGAERSALAESVPLELSVAGAGV